MPARNSQKSNVEAKVSSENNLDPEILCDWKICKNRGEYPRCFLENYSRCPERNERNGNARKIYCL